MVFVDEQIVELLIVLRAWILQVYVQRVLLLLSQLLVEDLGLGVVRGLVEEVQYRVWRIPMEMVCVVVLVDEYILMLQEWILEDCVQLD